MSFVFISHANPDKSRIRHVVDALIADGHKVWLDNPAAMGYGAADIRSHFFRLHADRPWRDEIDEAIREAGVVLVCFSKRFSEQRDMWQDEAAGARILQKLVSCRIDDVDPQTLRNNYSLQQIVDLDGGRSQEELKTALALLLDDVKRTLAVSLQRRLDGRRQVRRDPFIPYLIDRTIQEEQIGDAIEVVSRDGGAHAFVVVGPQNECLDEFIDRLQRYSCAERCGAGRSWHRLIVEWPDRGASMEFARTFERRLARELELPTGASAAEIAAGLARVGRPAAVLSLLDASEWRADEEKRVRTWLSVWHRLTQEPQRFSAVPILCLKMPAAKPGWRICPSGTAPGASMSNAAIWRAVGRFQRKPSGLRAWLFPPPPIRAPIGVPPVLHPVTRKHANEWLWRHIATEQADGAPADTGQSIERLFAGGVAAKHGIALRDFADGVKPLFEGG
jgi:TIR domain/inactive STAND